MRELTLGSLFDGLGGWLLAAKENGIRPIWSSEIDDFPMAVSKYHFPEVQQLGDITKLDGAELPPVDIICAGSPCQDLSIAGKREGLAGERSGLFRKAIDIVRGMRKATNGEYPKWFVWENVPGAFSSNKGHDFRAVLEEITETDIPMPDSGRWSKGGWLEAQNAMWHGEHLTLNTGVSPSVERESFLLQVLEPTADQKYYLSQKACLGILRRAKTRGKVLPEILHKALTQQAGLSSQVSQAVMAGN